MVCRTPSWPMPLPGTTWLSAMAMKRRMARKVLKTKRKTRAAFGMTSSLEMMLSVLRYSDIV